MSTRFDLGEGVLEASLTKTLDMELYNWLGRKPEFGMPLTGNRSSFLKTARDIFGACVAESVAAPGQAGYRSGFFLMVSNANLAVLDVLLGGTGARSYLDAVLAAASFLEIAKPPKSKYLDRSPINWNPYGGTRMESVARRTSQDSAYILGDLTGRVAEALFYRAADVKRRRANADRLAQLRATVRLLDGALGRVRKEDETVAAGPQLAVTEETRPAGQGSSTPPSASAPAVTQPPVYPAPTRPRQQPGRRVR